MRFRNPIIAIAVVIAVAGLSLFVFVSSSSADYGCSVNVTPSPAPSASPTGSQRLGQPEPDMGRNHIVAGTKVQYTYCPPASGPHVNQAGFGPLQPNVYGPDDRALPQGWVHNLEHGGLVLLYSCSKGACDDATLTALRQFFRSFPTSEVCHTPPGIVGPVIARFDNLPTKFAAIVWGRLLFLDSLDTTTIIQFFQTEAERLNPEKTGLVSPPEPQVNPGCAALLQQLQASASPSASASAPASASASAPASASPSAAPSSVAPSASASAAAPGASASASPTSS